MNIYKITNKINNMVYIGATYQRINERWYCHKSYARNNRGSSIHKDMNRIGIDNFKIELIEECKSKDELLDREIFWIKELNTLWPSGYNRRTCYEDLCKETIDIMSKSHSGKNNYNYGRHRLESTKRILSVKGKLRGIPKQCILASTKANKKKVVHKGIIYNSITEASILLGIELSAISKIAKGLTKKSKYGVFEFYEVSIL